MTMTKREKHNAMNELLKISMDEQANIDMRVAAHNMRCMLHADIYKDAEHYQFMVE